MYTITLLIWAFILIAAIYAFADIVIPLFQGNEPFTIWKSLFSKKRRRR